MHSPRPTIYFIRHGETDWNLEGRLQGQKDIPLNKLGRVQAEEAGRRLRSVCPHYEDLAYVASPMRRTRDTMEILRGTIGLPPQGYGVDERLIEITFGAWEGMTWKEVRRAEPQLAALRERDKWNYVPPGGGESYAMLVDRIRPVLDDLTRDTVIVAHGGVARAFLSLCCGISSRQAASMDIWQGRVLVLQDRKHRWV
ncbi:histidine phosphatase family protein [Microvirga makkahensis]|uniref:Histidine phosphatase family protein n=1 Tax=Microvirga makkahensis TaxID=1128670 RepID=A0A7X3MTX5_9HYPH|nr:histidine phosphatase family protein [Microvirga makkahensis]MXQ12925.1 histidine phosphatase family protein [Microvirga makkahensis]